MMIFKCKMCGGDIQVTDGAAFGTCGSCGTTSTLPKASDEKLVNLFNRANHFRRLNEFDKALTAYENILNEDVASAEAHWCAVLCRYGIEYVEDPRTHERVPTCHRAQYTSILTDVDYLATLEFSPDNYTRGLYESEAQKISEIQKGILTISSREKPFDVFICYKETTDGGNRTKDSVLAQDIYHQLKDDYRVFFSKITLEDKLGQEYEPYIFAALNSAKVMLVVGTKPDYFNAVWVKNEWSRFLSLTKNDRSRLLIPCHRDMEAYDLPEELSMLQSQDMSKIGFIQDIVRGVKKVLGEHITSSAAQAAGNASVAGIDSYMKRGSIFLEDGEWTQANEYFDKVLDINPEYALAYIGKLCAEFHAYSQSELLKLGKPLDTSSQYKNALRFADDSLKVELLKLNGEIADKIALLETEKEERRKKCADMAKRIIAYDGNLIITNPDGTITSCVAKNADSDSRLEAMSLWRDVVAVTCTKDTPRRIHMRGLKSNGTVIGVSAWQDIIAISGSFALRSDGTVVTTNNELFNRVSEWRNIVAISGGDNYGAGLKSDGTIIEVREGRDARDFSAIKSVIAIKMTEWHLIALKSDGTVFASDFYTRENGGLSESEKKHAKKVEGYRSGYTFELDVSKWNDIVAIGGERNIAFGIRSDGSVVMANSSGRFEGELTPQALAMRDLLAAEISITGAKPVLFGIQSSGAPSVVQEYVPLFQMRSPQYYEKVLKQREEWARQGLCTKCGGKLSGLFTKTCKSCGEESGGGLLDRMESFVDRIGDGF